MTEPSPAALQARADALLQSGDVPAAIAAHHVLLTHAPDRADAWYNLAWLQRSARHFDDALASYAEALARGIDAPQAVHVNRAVILAEHLARAAEGEAELHRALAADPGFLPAWLNLGLFAEDRGDAAAARGAYARAARLHPGNGRAAARLAALDVDAGDVADATAQLERLLADRTLDPEDAAEVGFALGNARDAAGQYDAAFAAFVEANRAARALIPPARRYDRAAQDRLVDAIVATFDGSAPVATADDGPAPVFICGMFRSGSTLCERLLAAHGRVTAGGELEAIPAMVAGLQPWPAAMRTADPAALCETYRAEANRLFPGADILTDKRCDNVFHIGLIKAMFPAARIVHTHRQPLDNILSVFFLHFGDGVPYGFDLDDAVHYYRSYRRVLDHWRALYADDIFDFDYDAVVAEPAPTMRALLDFLGLESEAAALSGAPAPGIVRTPSAWAVRRPVHSGSSSRWRNYAGYIPQVIAALKGY